MTRLKKPTDPVKPSAPDPVDAWLDVLVAMLSIPKPDRQRVRDELEDHLRSRIDDLLIHGLTEPQALQKAVAELGETADLARQLSHAHKPPRTRRYAMHALLIALTGTVVALGVNTMRPNTGLPASAVVGNTQEDQAADAAAPSKTGDLLTTSVDVPAGGEISIEALLQRFADRLETPLALDAVALSRIRVDPATKISYPENHSGSELFSSALRRIQETSGHSTFAMAPEIRLAAAIIDGELFITMQRDLDLMTTSRRVYPLARFAENAPNPITGIDARWAYERVVSSIMEHVSPLDWHDNGGDLARGTIVGSSLIVTAPVRIHEQIRAMLDELHAQAVEQAAQRAAAEAEQREAAAREHQSLVTRIKQEYERALSEQIDLAQRIETLESAISQARRSMALPAEERGDAKPMQEFARHITELKSHMIRMEEATARVDYLRMRMIEIEYEPLVRDRDANAARNRHVRPGVVTVRGEGLREGQYEIVPGMTLSRMIAAAGGFSDPIPGKVQLIRGDEVVYEWSADTMHTPSAAGTKLLPGDTIAVVD